MQKLERALGMLSKVRYYAGKTEFKNICHTLFESHLIRLWKLESIKYSTNQRKNCKVTKELFENHLFCRISSRFPENHIHLYLRNRKSLRSKILSKCKIDFFWVHSIKENLIYNFQKMMIFT